MKNFGSLLLAAVLSLPIVTASVEKEDIEARVKKTEIKPENAKGGINKLIKSGFLKPVSSRDSNNRDRDLRGGVPRPTGRNAPRNRAPPTHPQQPQNAGRKKKPADTQRHQSNDDWYDDYFVYYDDGPAYDDYYDDHYYGQDDIYYDDHYHDDQYVDDYYGKGGYDDYYVDDYYYGGKGKGKGGKKSSKKGKGGKGKGEGKGGKKSSKKGKGGKGKGNGKGGYYDDDFYLDDDIFSGFDDDIFGGIGEPFEYYIQGFVDTRDVGSPIYPNPSAPDDFAAGNVNLYSDTLLWDVENVGVSALLGLVQGTCTRTDPNDVDSSEYEGSGVCSFTFEALFGSDVVASFTAEGTVMNGAGAQLVIKGGVGQFSGVSGEVFLETAFLDFDFSPPLAQPDPTIDFLASPDGYIMYGYINSDSRIDLLQGDDDFFSGIDDNLFGDDFAFTDDLVTSDPGSIFPASEFPTDSPIEVVQCPTLPSDDFCDCDSDCGTIRCECEEGLLCCAAGSE